jgi:hypothetical protein
MTAESTHIDELDGLVTRACEIGRRMAHTTPARAAALGAEALEIYRAMSDVTARPQEVAVADILSQDIEGGLLDAACLPIRPPAAPQAALFLRLQDHVTVQCGGRDIRLPTARPRNAFLRATWTRDPNSVSTDARAQLTPFGGVVARCWNVALALGAEPTHKQMQAWGWSPHARVKGIEFFRSGLSHLIRRSFHHKASRNINGFRDAVNDALRNIVVLPSQSQALTGQAPGLHAGDISRELLSEEVGNEVQTLLEEAASRGVGNAGHLMAQDISAIAGVPISVVYALRDSLPRSSPLRQTMSFEVNLGRATNRLHYKPDFASWVLRQIILSRTKDAA